MPELGPHEVSLVVAGEAAADAGRGTARPDRPGAGPPCRSQELRKTKMHSALPASKGKTAWARVELGSRVGEVLGDQQASAGSFQGQERERYCQQG